MLQDANYNVVGLVRDCDNTLIRQFAYTPYCQFLAKEDGTGAALSAGDPLEIWHSFQGLIHNPSSGLSYARGREYNPRIGRFLQRDPNEQALILANVMAMNGQTRRAFASMSPRSQYLDGMNLYQFVGGNPITGRDPSGQFLYLDTLGAAANSAW